MDKTSPQPTNQNGRRTTTTTTNYDDHDGRRRKDKTCFSIGWLRTVYSIQNIVDSQRQGEKDIGIIGIEYTLQYKGSEIHKNLPPKRARVSLSVKSLLPESFIDMANKTETSKIS